MCAFNYTTKQWTSNPSKKKQMYTVQDNLDLPKIRGLLTAIRCKADPGLEFGTEDALEPDIFLSQIQAFIDLLRKLGVENKNIKARLQDTKNTLEEVKHISKEWEKSFFEQDTISRKQA